MKARDSWTITKRTVQSFLRDDAITLAAALAFYAGLSLAPLIVLLVWITSFLNPEMQQRILEQAVGVVGQGGAEGLRMIMQNAAQQPEAGSIAGIISIIMLVLAATGVFGQLQRSLNLIWDVESTGTGIVSMIFKRLLALLMVFAIGAFLIASMILSAVISGGSRMAGGMFAALPWLWQIVDFVAPLLLFVPLFAALFRFVPDVKIQWRDVWVGATFTAALFALGKAVLGMYLGQGGVNSAYGAAGSFLALLLWVYYSSMIIFLGAEMTQVWAWYTGSAIRPSKHAKWRHTKPIGKPKDELHEAPDAHPRPA
jgi:membrane protein